MSILKNNLNITLVPPSPCSERIKIDIRAAILNDCRQARKIAIAIYLDKPEQKNLLCNKVETVKPGEYFLVRFMWPALGHIGRHRIIAQAEIEDEIITAESDIEIVSSETISLRQIDGAWAGIAHWSDTEGKFWQDDIKKLNDNQWREIVKGMNEIGMKIIIIQEVLRNEEYVGKHKIEKQGYKGKAYYPSKLYPERVQITAVNPIEAILDEADKTGSCVFLGVGMYAWFDFTKGSLEWHKKTAKELWELYGHHKSLYGWYISEEVFGNLGDNEERRKEIVLFFKEFKKYVNKLCPDKPIMLAPNCHNIIEGLKYWPQLLKNLDIVCPFGFHRMPKDDMTGEQAAALLRKLCNESDSQLWLDMEVFLFAEDQALYPRPIEGVVSDFSRFDNFEKILCYQYPGLMTPPWAQIKLGGQLAVNLFNDYKKFIKTGSLQT
jgi:hypothetical protein